MASSITKNDLTKAAALFISAARDTSLSLQQWAILACIAERPGLSVKDIAARLSILRSRTSLSVDELVAAGLVARDKDSADRRLVRLTLTPSGEKLLRRIEASEPQPASAS